ncbi:MAG: MFS transporter [Pseudomonadota bacterium]
MLSWGNITRLCLINMAIGGLSALPINLFNRLMVVELALPAILPGLLVALHYGVQVTRPYWGHRSDANERGTLLILGGIALVGVSLITTAAAIAYAPSISLAITIWILAYVMLGFGIGAAGTSFLALLASHTDDSRKGAAATIAWLFLILGAVVFSITTGQLLDPYTPQRLVLIVALMVLLALLLSTIAIFGMEAKIGKSVPAEPNFKRALSATFADPSARAFTGFVFLSILAFYLSELVLEPFAGAVHGMSPDATTTLSGGKDGAALVGILAAGALSTFQIGTLRFWAIVGCALSAIGLLGLSAGGGVIGFTIVLGLGNGLFVVGAIGSMMRLAAQAKGASGVRMGVFGASQAIAAGIAGLVATGMVDLIGLALPMHQAYASVFILEAGLFLAAALVAAKLLPSTPTRFTLSEEAHV